MSREDRLNYVRATLARAGRAGASIVETTPAMGGLRARDVMILVRLGEAEWVWPGTRARLKEFANHLSPSNH
jgi:hypothetical protein